ncbi:hypothetical protein DY000_02055139 [Brassica cretica]|uniref:Uncharacterized protein n=1 Tax=Brassica cretica TaxID=69181 RepID=A0ABQ7AE51_BRACR|nr:hypothetical protein DY000_02055139 [Brassica cretica]
MEMEMRWRKTASMEKPASFGEIRASYLTNSTMVKESLRMASVVPWFPRLVLQDCEMEGLL